MSVAAPPIHISMPEICDHSKHTAEIISTIHEAAALSNRGTNLHASQRSRTLEMQTGVLRYKQMGVPHMSASPVTLLCLAHG